MEIHVFLLHYLLELVSYFYVISFYVIPLFLDQEEANFSESEEDVGSDESGEELDDEGSSPESDGEELTSGDGGEESEEEEALQLLGNIRAKGTENHKLTKKEKKKAAKKSAEKLAALKQEEVEQCMKPPVAHLLNSTWFWVELLGNGCELLEITMKC